MDGSNKEKTNKKDNKFKILSEEEFDTQLKKKVDKLKDLFADNNKKDTHDDEER